MSCYDSRLLSHVLLREAVTSGKRKRELWDGYINTLARYPKLYHELVTDLKPVRTEDLQVILLIGDTGCGKTKSVYDAHGKDVEFYRTPLNVGTQWYDGYDMHKIVLLDDFSGSSSHMNLVALLQLLDRNPLQVPIKGGYTLWLPEKIYLTTNLEPAKWYTWEGRAKQYLALARRFTSVRVYYADDKYIEYEKSENNWAAGWWRDNCPDEAKSLYDFSPLGLGGSIMQ